MTKSNPFQLDTLFWITASFLTLYFSDIVNVLKIDPRVGGTYFYVSIILTLIPVLIGSYFIVWLGLLKGIDDSQWDSHSTLAFPAATLCAVLAGIFWNISLWGVYRFWSPVLLFLLFMGFIMIVSILPPWSTSSKAETKDGGVSIKRE